MRTPMASANIAIINELKKELNVIIQYRREYYTSSSQDFTRNRTLTFSTIVMLILNTLKRSLSIELQQFFGHFSRGMICSKQAFSAQRTKLQPHFFHDWNDVLVKNFYFHYGKYAKRWNGMRLWAMDGSTIAVPDTQVMRKEFGCTSNGKGETAPVVRICLLYDVLNQIVIKGMLHSYRTSELSSVLPCIKNQCLEDTVLLFDRGYMSFCLLYSLFEKRANFVMRVPRTANNCVKSFINSPENDQIMDWCPNYDSMKKLRSMGIEASKETTIRIRLVKVLLDTGETEVLITNLYDTSLYTRADMKEVYRLRWGVETAYKYLKEELQLGQFSGLRRICIEQDVAANLFLYNLQSLIEKQTEPYTEAVSRRREYAYKVNKNISFASLKNRVVQLFVEDNSETVLKELEVLFERYLEPIRPNRKFPRVKKRPPNGKIYTLTNYKRAL
jgi:hypothetical protein